MYVWAGRKKTKQAGQRGTCRHSRPASHIRATRAHYIHRVADSKPITHSLQNQDGSGCMCGVGRKKTIQGSQEGHMLAWPAISTHLSNEGI